MTSWMSVWVLLIPIQVHVYLTLTIYIISRLKSLTENKIELECENIRLV